MVEIITFPGTKCKAPPPRSAGGDVSAGGFRKGLLRVDLKLGDHDNERRLLCLRRDGGGLKRGVEMDLSTLKIEDFYMMVKSVKNPNNTSLRLYNGTRDKDDGRFERVRFKSSDPKIRFAMESFSRRLARAVSAGGWLQQLELGFNMRKQNIKILSEALGCSSNLRHLSFASSSLGDERLRLLAQGLSDCCPLQVLDLSCCALTDASSISLAAVLKAGVRRTSEAEWQSSLRASSGGPGRAQRGDQKLGASQGLTALNLSFNMLTDVTSRHLCDVIRLGARLQALNLQGNQLQKKSAQHFVRVYEAWGVLRLVDLRKNLDGNDVGVLEDGKHLHFFSSSHPPFWNSSSGPPPPSENIALQERILSTHQRGEKGSSRRSRSLPCRPGQETEPNTSDHSSTTQRTSNLASLGSVFEDQDKTHFTSDAVMMLQSLSCERDFTPDDEMGTEAEDLSHPSRRNWTSRIAWPPEAPPPPIPRGDAHSSISNDRSVPLSRHRRSEDHHHHEPRLKLVELHQPGQTSSRAAIEDDQLSTTPILDVHRAYPGLLQINSSTDGNVEEERLFQDLSTLRHFSKARHHQHFHPELEEKEQSASPSSRAASSSLQDPPTPELFADKKLQQQPATKWASNKEERPPEGGGGVSSYSDAAVVSSGHHPFRDADNNDAVHDQGPARHQEEEEHVAPVPRQRPNAVGGRQQEQQEPHEINKRGSNNRQIHQPKRSTSHSHSHQKRISGPKSSGVKIPVKKSSVQCKEEDDTLRRRKPRVDCKRRVLQRTHKPSSSQQQHSPVHSLAASEWKRQESEWGAFMQDMTKTLIHLQEGVQVLMGNPSMEPNHEVAGQAKVAKLSHVLQW